MAQKKREMTIGLRQKVMSQLNATPTKLYTHNDIERILKINAKAATNATYNLFRDGLIQRHVNKSKDGLYQYAIKISEGKSVKYEAQQTNKSSQKKKKPAITLREVRMAFAQTQNQLAKLEDIISQIMEENDEFNKMFNKIRNLTP